ncbi:hypothetical protein PDESU_00641 [Pontiella desulfatans]|uniref:Lipoprotein n=1 Tax=Pontiella desulfatans TaxID=2750659 RepID=A0A6C2TXM8_PONDE|nr:hypothetical protein [Pontiella desulfatans]VGO12091.1 hypothetical protein PDESU_00641 [Pontiella desulfatans]
MKKCGWMVLLLGMAVLSSGCVSGRKVRSAEKMKSSNPMRNIAIFGGGRVFYPRQMGMGVLLCSTQTDRAIKALLAQTTTAFQMKGYSVVLAQPAGIGFFDTAHRDYWAYSDLEGNSPKVRHDTEVPVYVYPYVKTRPDLEQALRKLYRGLNDGHRFEPSVDDLAVVRKYTGADTVALVRMRGIEYTAERKVGVAMLGVAAAALGSYNSSTPKETTEAIVVCMEVATGEVLWQSGMWLQTVPAKPDPLLMIELLEPLPKAGYAINPKYVN